MVKSTVKKPSSSSSSSSSGVRQLDFQPYLGSTLESFVYYLYYVLSYGLLEFVFTKSYSPFQSFPDYVRHLLISFTAQTLWLNFFAFGYETFPEITVAAYLFKKTRRTKLSTFLHILSTMAGAGAAGLLLSSIFYKNFAKERPLLIPRFPEYDNQFGSIAKVKLQTLIAFWTTSNLQTFFFSEIFFSFIYCFTTIVLVYQTKTTGGSPTGISELKRYVSGTVIYLSRISFGERSSLNLGFTSECAAYFGNVLILVTLGVGNIIGFLVAYIVFETQLRGGPIVLFNQSFTMTPLYLFRKHTESGRLVRRGALREPAVSTSPTPSSASSKSTTSSGIKRSKLKSGDSGNEGTVTRRTTRSRK